MQNLSKIFDISDVTILKTFKKIVPYRKYIMNDDISDKLFINIKEKNHNEYVDDIITNLEKNMFEFNLVINNFKYNVPSTTMTLV